MPRNQERCRGRIEYLAIETSTGKITGAKEVADSLNKYLTKHPTEQWITPLIHYTRQPMNKMKMPTTVTQKMSLEPTQTSEIVEIIRSMETEEIFRMGRSSY
jgi:hypothetical protein